MGMYTEINVCFDLFKATSKESKKVVNILHSLIDNVEMPTVLPKHDFFKCDSWKMVACGNSYYFDGSTNSKMIYDIISKTWKINIRANLKNYDFEIEKFLNWLAPYIKTNGFIGYIRNEDCSDLTLVYIEQGKVIFLKVWKL